METKNVILHYRLTESEKMLLDMLCEKFEIEQKEYLRLSINLLCNVKKGVVSDKACKYVVVDFDVYKKIRVELMRWGYHYNQSVHALNEIAYHMRNRDPIHNEEILTTLQRLEDRLDKLEEGKNEMKKLMDKINKKSLIRKE